MCMSPCSSECIFNMYIYVHRGQWFRPRGGGGGGGGGGGSALCCSTRLVAAGVQI